MTSEAPLISGPLSIGEVFDRGFRLFRARTSPLLMITAAVLFPLGIIATVFTIATAPEVPITPTSVSPFGGSAGTLIDRLFAFSTQSQESSGLGLINLLSGILTMVVTLALVHQINALLHGGELHTKRALRAGARRLIAYIGMLILVALAFIPVAIVAGILAYIFAPLVVLIVPVVVYLMTGWAIILPPFVIEELGAGGALGRSWQLTEGYRWRTLGFFVVLSLLGAVITYVPTLSIFSLFVAILPASTGRFLAGLDVTLTMLITMLWLPISTACSVIYYFDLRVRKESYDLELQMKEVQATVDVSNPGLGHAWPEE